MTTSMYCLYVGFDYTYIDINALTQGIKSFLAPIRPQLLVRHAMYVCVCMYVCMYVCIYVCVCMYVNVCVSMYVCSYVYMYYVCSYVCVCMYVCVCV